MSCHNMAHLRQEISHVFCKSLQFRHIIGLNLPHTDPNRVQISLQMPNTGRFQAIKLSERANSLLHTHHQIHTLRDIAEPGGSDLHLR